MKDANWFQRFFTPPPQREYDERVLQIESLVFRDVLIAVVLVLLSGLFLLNLPATKSLFRNDAGYSLLPIIAILVAAIVSLISKTARGSWSWSRQRRQAKLMLAVGVPAYILIGIAMFFLQGARLSFFWVVVEPALMFLIVPVFILLLSRNKG